MVVCTQCSCQYSAQLNSCPQCQFPRATPNGNTVSAPTLLTELQKPSGLAPTSKKRRTPLLLLTLVPVLAIVVVFALIGLGIIPKFWNTEDATDNDVILPSVQGLSLDEAQTKLEDSGLVISKTETVYTLLPDATGTVFETVPEAGTHLPSGSTVEIRVLESIDLEEVQPYLAENNTLLSWVEDDPEWLIGTWNGEYIRTDDTSTNCDAGYSHPMKITVKSVNPDAGNADIVFEGLMHAHDNDSGENMHFDSSRDVWENFGAKPQVFGFDVQEEVSILAWENKDLRYDSDRHPIYVVLYIMTDMDTSSPETLAELLVDDTEGVYDTKEEAFAAVLKKVRENSWLEARIYQGHDSYSARDFLEVFTMTKDGDTSVPEPKISSSPQASSSPQEGYSPQEGSSPQASSRSSSSATPSKSPTSTR